MYKNDDPFRVWNNPMNDSPFAPHNSINADDPSKPWNSPFGKESDLTNEEAKYYGIKRRSYYDNENEYDY